MQDVLISIHSYSSAAANKHSELAEKITTSYSTVDGHDDSMCKVHYNYNLFSIILL